MNSQCTDRVAFKIKQDILYHRSLSEEHGIQYQVVVPERLLPTVLTYFHDSSLGAHLGRLKTVLISLGSAPKWNRFFLGLCSTAPPSVVKIGQVVFA